MQLDLTCKYSVEKYPLQFLGIVCVGLCTGKRPVCDWPLNDSWELTS